MYIRELCDKWGDHIFNQCYYGCNNPQNIPCKPEETFSIESVELVKTIYCYSTEWIVNLIVDGQRWMTRLTRLNGETESSLRVKIQKHSKDRKIERLNQYIAYIHLRIRIRKCMYAFLSIMSLLNKETFNMNDLERKLLQILYNYFSKNRVIPSWTVLLQTTGKSKT